MKLKIRGSGNSVNLTKRDFLAKGGEGSIYVKPPKVYKVCEPGKMIPEGKISELAVLDSPKVLRPEEVLIDASKKVPVGYSMNYVADTHVLCQLFTKAFRKRNGIDNSIMWDLVQDMVETTKFIHSNKILVVDYNELNFLVSQNFDSVYFIDVNSYQTPSYPATAIMESIRDRHCQGKFSEGTDWFSAGIVTFQMLIGIHPFKGKHPKFTNPKTSMDDRMKANIPIMDKNVSYPKGACQPLDIIPDPWMKWYEDMFSKGLRVPPPGVAGATIVIMKPTFDTVKGSNNFDINEMHDFKDEIISTFIYGGKEVVVTTSGLFIDRRKNNHAKVSPEMKVGFTEDTLLPVEARAEKRNLKLTNLNTGDDIKTSLYADDIMTYDGRIYVRNGSNVLEMEFTQIGPKIVASPKQVGNVLEQAAHTFEGVIVENLFDSHYFSMFPETGICRQMAIRELDEYKIVDAKFDKGLLVVIGVNSKTGEYDRFTFWFDQNWKSYQVCVDSNITYVGLNFTVLDNGVCVLINEEEKVEVFRITDPTKKKIVTDDVIEGDMKLMSVGAQTLFTKDSKLHSFKMN